MQCRLPSSRPRRAAGWRRTGLAIVACAALASVVWSGADYERLLALAKARYGDEAYARVEAWKSLTLEYARSPEREKLDATNRFFNAQVTFASDEEVWSESDYWATPLEVLGVRRGDCEDFSVAKYATLLLLGVPMEKLRLVYVKATIGGPRSRVTQAHMVVAYYANPGSDPLILDNLVEEILPAPRRPDLRPVFSFNSAGLWVGNDGRRATGDPGSRLSRWQTVLRRMHDDGLEHEREESK